MALLKTSKYLHPAPQNTGSANHDHLHPRVATPDVYTNTVGRFLGEATNIYGKIIDNPVAERITNGIVQKGWRALLIAKSFKRKAWDAANKVRAQERTYVASNYTDAVKLRQYAIDEDQRNREDKYQPKIQFGHNYGLITALGEKVETVVDLLGKTDDTSALVIPNQVIIYNLFGEELDKVVLQVRPNTIEMKPESSWADIKSMGRNLPMYHYLGASQELHINTSWFLSKAPTDPEFNPFEVINNCRKLESWSMANGYYSAPPILQIEWGRSGIFENQFWILASATYNLRDFHDRVMVIADTSPQYTYDEKGSMIAEYRPNNRGMINAGLIPFSATQELIFRRVSDHNLLHSEICPPLQLSTPTKTESI